MKLEIGLPYEAGIVASFDETTGKGLLCACQDMTPEMTWHEANKRILSPWRLPTKDELNQMYVNLKKQGKGGFSSDLYWSSSQDNNYYAWSQNFSSGSQYRHYKSYVYRVRAVRDFQI